MNCLLKSSDKYYSFTVYISIFHNTIIISLTDKSNIKSSHIAGDRLHQRGCEFHRLYKIIVQEYFHSSKYYTRIDMEILETPVYKKIFVKFFLNISNTIGLIPIFALTKKIKL